MTSSEEYHRPRTSSARTDFVAVTVFRQFGAQYDSMNRLTKKPGDFTYPDFKKVTIGFMAQGFSGSDDFSDGISFAGEGLASSSPCLVISLIK